MNLPRILIAGLCGGGGKTLIATGLLAAWRKAGREPAPFKKGPDYIDAAWLSVAARRPCRNLDPFLMSPQVIGRSFATSCGGADVALIEGNRGLFDGVDADGTYSSAELAKLLNAPVILIVDCTKSTRTVAASVLGCQHLDPRVPLRGVILNRTAGARHVSVLRQAIEQICHLPVLGAVARVDGPIFPERHLGLVPPQEHGEVAGAIRRAGELAGQYLDLDGIWELARKAPAMAAVAGCQLPVASRGPGNWQLATGNSPGRVRIGVFRDAAFQFYYPENLEALVREGAELIEISPLRDAELPEVDGLYIGGGFPETLAATLSMNARFLDSVRRAADAGLPMYAECGGAVFLGEKLLMEGQQYAMAGVLPVVFGFGTKPRGHGYAVIETAAENPFFSVGEALRGHEFHYTYVHAWTADDLTFAFRVRRGYGFDGERDGLCRRNVLACYTHLHALSAEGWAPAVVRAAARWGRRSASAAISGSRRRLCPDELESTVGP